MAQCLFCNSDLIQTAGKKEKQFCNTSCRSNYWYGKNKKGKFKVGSTIGKSVITEVKEIKQETIVTAILPPKNLTGMALELWQNRQEFLKK